MSIDLLGSFNRKLAAGALMASVLAPVAAQAVDQGTCLPVDDMWTQLRAEGQHELANFDSATVKKSGVVTTPMVLTADKTLKSGYVLSRGDRWGVPELCVKEPAKGGPSGRIVVLDPAQRGVNKLTLLKDVPNEGGRLNYGVNALAKAGAFVGFQYGSAEGYLVTAFSKADNPAERHIVMANSAVDGKYIDTRVLSMANFRLTGDGVKVATALGKYSVPQTEIKPEKQ